MLKNCLFHSLATNKRKPENDDGSLSDYGSQVDSQPQPKKQKPLNEEVDEKVGGDDEKVGGDDEKVGGEKVNEESKMEIERGDQHDDEKVGGEKVNEESTMEIERGDQHDDEKVGGEKVNEESKKEIERGDQHNGTNPDDPVMIINVCKTERNSSPELDEDSNSQFSHNNSFDCDIHGKITKKSFK